MRVHTACVAFISPDSESAVAMVRINFKIDKEKKAEIGTYVKENQEYSSMSHFFRLAANKEMNDDSEQPSQVSPRVTRTLDQIVSELDEIQDGINGITAQLNDDNRDIQTLAQEVYETIPVAPIANTAEVAAAGTSAQQLDRRHAQTVLQESDAPSTIPELARYLDADKEDIKEAIRRLKSNFLPILELVDEDGNKHFLKQEERR